MATQFFDIFRKTSDKDAVWVETVQDSRQAKKRLLSLNSAVQGTYLVFDQPAEKFIELFCRA